MRHRSTRLPSVLTSIIETAANDLDAFFPPPKSAPGSRRTDALLKRAERLEQLRFLDHGIEIHVAETPYDTVGVDTEEDLRRVEELLR